MPQHPIRFAGIPLSVLLLTATPSAAALFTGPFETAVMADPSDLTSGDVDGDGDLDLVVCSYLSSQITVLLNDGAGSFAPTPGGPLPSVPFPISSTLGSFNPDQDAFEDLIVVGDGGQTTASLFLGDGAGGFHPSSTFPVFPSMTIGKKVAVADSDGDGRDDLVFSSGQILLGRGDGTFAPAVSIHLAAPAFDVIAADFDGDGHRDAAFMEFATSTLRLFLRLPGGGFGEAAGSPVPIAGEPETLAAGDFDGDGDLDLAVTDIAGMGVHVLINEGGGPTTLSAFYPVRAAYPRGVASADFDGDGRGDLAVGSNNSPDLSILLAGDAGLAETGDSPLHVTGGVPFSIVADDLNGDGAPDLAAVDFQGGRIAVFFDSPPARVLEVPIDIQPGSADNVINVRSMGIVTVAILSTGEFDAATVDPATVLLAGAPVQRTPSGALECRQEDVNADAGIDLVCKIDKTALQLGAGDTVATLEAATFDGLHIHGQDSVRVIARQASLTTS